MKTPICDFVSDYIKRDTVRLHMPGHKGVCSLGCEVYDITEIDGADVLYNADGIIKESERNASRLFGTELTLYSTEGSSLCIRAMLFLVKAYAKSLGKEPKILAGRNAHKTFVSGASILNIDVKWLFSKSGSIVSCPIDFSELERNIKEYKPTALYVTSPDYLGNVLDIKRIAEACHKNGVLLITDNAHGAYLKFLEASLHPIDMGADMCCDSAHKTLPALTGSGYLHISKNAPKIFKERAEEAMSYFASTSPSYLVLQSLDRLNSVLADGYKKIISNKALEVTRLKQSLINAGYVLMGDESLKLTISAKKYGYRGAEIYEHLKERNFVCEFYDPDFVVMMISAETSTDELNLLKKALFELPKLTEIKELPPNMETPQRVIPMKEAMFMEKERVLTYEAEGRVFASSEVSCPPAIPVLVWGERIDKSAIECFEYYGKESLLVLKEKDFT